MEVAECNYSHPKIIEKKNDHDDIIESSKNQIGKKKKKKKKKKIFSMNSRIPHPNSDTLIIEKKMIMMI